AWARLLRHAPASSTANRTLVVQFDLVVELSGPGAVVGASLDFTPTGGGCVTGVGAVIAADAAVTLVAPPRVVGRSSLASAGGSVASPAVGSAGVASAGTCFFAAASEAVEAPSFITVVISS